MVTFLFLVGMSVSTVLLLAIAADEVSSRVGQFFARRQAAVLVRPAAVAAWGEYENAIRVDDLLSQLDMRGGRGTPVSTRDGSRNNGGNRIPDWAA